MYIHKFQMNLDEVIQEIVWSVYESVVEVFKVEKPEGDGDAVKTQKFRLLPAFPRTKGP